MSTNTPPLPILPLPILPLPILPLPLSGVTGHFAPLLTPSTLPIPCPFPGQHLSLRPEFLRWLQTLD